MMFEDITLDELSDDQQELAECIGIDAYRLLVKHYGGNSIYISQPKSLIRTNRNEMICNDYNGKNIKELTRKYGLSVSTIRNILKTRKET